MRKSVFPLTLSLALLLAGCVTINVYFPAAAAQKAADKIIGNIIGPEGAAQESPAPAGSTPPPASPDQGSVNGGAAGESLAMRMLDALIPAANAAEKQPDLDIHTPAIDAVMARMRSRYQATLKPLLDSGAIGFTHNGDVAIHDASRIPLAARGQANQAIAAENSDRAELYRQLAVANGHPEWASRMREAFAKRWIAMAHAGWYYQNASGNWQKK